MIRFLHEITTEEVGGKALGLKALKELGLRVPGTCVLVHPKAETLDDEKVRKHLALLGNGPKAVRSSAVSEDGVAVSFAGQFESYLGLHSFDDVKKAILQCILAVNADRVAAYSGKLMPGADLRISVILQNMVDSRIAGVVFSANPVNGRRDKIVINAVKGFGEELVSGMRDAHQYELFRSGSNVSAEAQKNGDLLTEAHLREILDGTILAEKRFGSPVDLEWAVDHAGLLHWLQARPVTTLDEVHYNELDSVKEASHDAWTLGNIGEMMPGVATPLTWSVTADAIDFGMTVLAQQCGAFRLKDRKGPRYIQMFYNRLFINMSNMMDYPKRVWLNTASDVQFALSGKTFPEIPAEPAVVLPIRIMNFFRQMYHTALADRYLGKLRRLEAGCSVETTGSMQDLYTILDRSRATLGEGFGYHLGTSAQSGTLYSAFMRIMTGGKRTPEAADHHIATMLLMNIPEIESADAVKSLHRLAMMIHRDEKLAGRFIAAGPEEALKILEHDAPEEIREYFRHFIKRHGHRCVRESELREKTWGENPLHLIKTLQTHVRGGAVSHTSRHDPDSADHILKDIPPLKRRILKAIIPAARKAVARREISKALSIKIVSKVRKGYAALALKMCHSGLLDDPDQIYFLTHAEIGLLLKDHSAHWKIKANKRRRILPEMDKLAFNEVSFGIPEPAGDLSPTEGQEGHLKGIPVSSGEVTGPVRIINTLEDTAFLQEGEIMVASFTDIGWTPCFNIIGGLITEIGSPLSHGAVVAREFGIPAVVGVKGARRLLKNGDLIRLNGDKGIIESIPQGSQYA